MRRGLIEREIEPPLLVALSKEYAVAPGLHLCALLVALWSVPLSLVPAVLLYIFFALPRVTERGGPFLPRALRRPSPTRNWSAHGSRWRESVA